jgi:hypothetical protein
MSNAHAHAGYGLVLKRAVIAAARTAGARAVDSSVDQRNTAMLNLNRKLGGVVDIIDPDDPDSKAHSTVKDRLRPRGSAYG